MADILRSHRVLFYRDGPSGSVAITQEGEHVFLRVNGKMDAGTAIDMGTQLMSGHLPMLVHPDPREVLVIGMGSGITAGAVSRYPVERLDIVEIEPAVLEASRFFAHIHGGVLQDPRVRAIVADGRNYLLTTPERYDVIISEPSNPWIGGLASLFSVEFFDIARQRLRPGGIMLQWIQGYGLRAEDLQMVVRTFRTAFPAATMWNTIPGDFLLVGQRETVPLDLERLRDRYQTNPAVWRELERLRIQSWGNVLGYFTLGAEDAARFSAGTALNTDDRLPLEFSAPRSIYLDTALANWRLVRSFKTADLPPVTPGSQALLARAEVRHAIAIGYLTREVPGDALEHLERGLAAAPDDVPSLLGAAGALLTLGRPGPALERAQRAARLAPQYAGAHFLVGVALEGLGRRGEALAPLERAAGLEPGNAQYLAAYRRVAGGSGGSSQR
jgi:spermidine synthase